MKTGLVLLACSFALLGCVGASSADQRSKAAEFNEKAVEKAMKDKGQQKDLEDAKKREAAYLAAGQDKSGDAKQQEGPTDSPVQGGN